MGLLLLLSRLPHCSLLGTGLGMQEAQGELGSPLLVHANCVRPPVPILLETRCSVCQALTRPHKAADVEVESSYLQPGILCL